MFDPTGVTGIESAHWTPLRAAASSRVLRLRPKRSLTPHRGATQPSPEPARRLPVRARDDGEGHYGGALGQPARAQAVEEIRRGADRHGGYRSARNWPAMTVPVAVVTSWPSTVWELRLNVFRLVARCSSEGRLTRCRVEQVETPEPGGHAAGRGARSGGVDRRVRRDAWTEGDIDIERDGPGHELQSRAVGSHLVPGQVMAWPLAGRARDASRRCSESCSESRNDRASLTGRRDGVEPPDECRPQRWKRIPGPHFARSRRQRAQSVAARR